MSGDFEKEHSEENEEIHGNCDRCNAYPAERKCSLFDEDMDYGVMEGEICHDCCWSTFEDEPERCVQNCDDPSCVKRLQLGVLKKIAEERKFKKSSKNPESYLNSANTILVGFFKEGGTKQFKGKVLPIETFYSGDEYDFVKTAKQKYTYSKDDFDEALKFLKKIGEDDLKYEVYSKSGILVLEGYYAWALVAGASIEWAYMHETGHFVENVKSGYAIFEDDVKKEISIVDLATDASLNWARLKPRQFEELCADILSSFASISECVLTGASGDEGRDIKAKEEVETIGGAESRNWCVQCKHFPGRSVGRQEIEDLDKLHTRFRFDVYCIMTSGTFSPNAVRLLEAYEGKRYKIIYMDRRTLETRIKSTPSLLKKFVALTSK